MQRPEEECSRQQDSWVKHQGEKECGTLEERKKASRTGTSQGRREGQGPDLKWLYIRSLGFILTSIGSTKGSLTG